MLLNGGWDAFLNHTDLKFRETPGFLNWMDAKDQMVEEEGEKTHRRVKV